MSCNHPESGIPPEIKGRHSLSFIISMIIFMSILAVLLISGAIILLIHGVQGVEAAAAWRPLRFFLIIAGYSLIVGPLIATVICQLPIRTVDAQINAMNRMAGGDFKVRLESPPAFMRGTTVDKVTESFNKMAEELEGTEVLREDFVNNFSHEFKTPIVSIAGFASLLRKGNLSEEEQQEYLEIIESESRRLAEMATNVLTMTKVEKYMILRDVEEYNLSEQLRRTILMLEEKWTEKGLDLDPEFDEFMIRGNESLMDQVWINLMDNAVKYTPEGGTIRIRVRDSEDQTCVEISNTGIEIPKEKQDKIFHKFYQADESHSSKGTGVGLAIVKYVVELHHGVVTVSSKDMVTKFTVVIPKNLTES